MTLQAEEGLATLICGIKYVRGTWIGACRGANESIVFARRAE